jgi:hypothetical protein
MHPFPANYKQYSFCPFNGLRVSDASSHLLFLRLLRLNATLLTVSPYRTDRDATDNALERTLHNMASACAHVTGCPKTLRKRRSCDGRWTAMRMYMFYASKIACTLVGNGRK